MSGVFDILRSRPAGWFVRRAIQDAGRLPGDLVRRPLDAFRGTFARSHPGPSGFEWLRWSPACLPAEEREALLDRARLFVDHRFDILGSGWVRFSRSRASVAGTPRGNRSEVRRIRSLIPPEHDPIDWHRDVKSGHRWPASAWYRSIRVRPGRGIDVKVPWELARMHHLVTLAQAHHCTRSSIYAKEFRAQVLDFVASNPPRYGVNWRCTMDTAIRIVNWLVAHDLFGAAGVRFDSEFETVFWRSVYEHGRHIRGNLEGVAGFRGNHYLADVAGLIFVAGYLDPDPEIDEWLGVGYEGFLDATRRQFHPDGSNFEASTSYHRLAGEIVLYTIAFLSSLPKERTRDLSGADSGEGGDRVVPAWLVERLGRIGAFVRDATGPDGRAIQIGDSDAGRWLKLHPVYRRMTVAEATSRFANLDGYDGLPPGAVYWYEDALDHGHLVAGIEAFLGLEPRAAPDPRAEAEARTIAGIAKTSPRGSEIARAGPVVALGDENAWDSWGARFDALDEARSVVIDLGDGALEKAPVRRAYPDFGLYLFRNERVFLSVRCGTIGHHGIGAHAHNDQLSITLRVDGREWIVDPGTYLYTPSSRWRERYRSVRSHFAPRFDSGEPRVLRQGCFSLRGAPEGRAVYFGERGFIGEVPEGSARVVLTGHRVVLQSIGASWPTSVPSIPYSPSYGVQERGPRSAAPENAISRDERA